MIGRCINTALFMMYAAALWGAAAAVDDVARQKRFVRQLFSEKRYFDAIAETGRLRSADPAGDSGRDYEFFININYYLGGQYRSVTRRITGLPGLPDYRSSVLLSQSYLRLGMYGRSLDAVRGIRYDAVDPLFRYRLLSRKADAYLACGLYRELAEEAAAAEPFVLERERLALLRGEAERHGSLPRVSVPLATALSALVPGAGQMYAGRYLSGIVSFLGVAAMAGGAVLFYRAGQKELAYTFIFFSSVFYLGNVYGAFNAARTANRDRERGFRDSLGKACLPAYDPEGEVRGNRVFR